MILNKDQRHNEIIGKIEALNKKLDEVLELIRMEAKSKPVEWLEPKEAMKYLKIGRTTLYRLMREGRLKYYKMGDSKYADLRFTHTQLNEALGEEIKGLVGDD